MQEKKEPTVVGPGLLQFIEIYGHVITNDNDGNLIVVTPAGPDIDIECEIIN